MRRRTGVEPATHDQCKTAITCWWWSQQQQQQQQQQLYKFRYKIITIVFIKTQQQHSNKEVINPVLLPCCLHKGRCIWRLKQKQNQLSAVNTHTRADTYSTHHKMVWYVTKYVCAPFSTILLKNPSQWLPPQFPSCCDREHWQSRDTRSLSGSMHCL